MSRPADEIPSQVEVIGTPKAVGFCEEWYTLNAEEHFWFSWRFRAFQSMLRGLRLNSASFRALDVGCGTGLLRSQLESATPWTVDCTDLNLEGLARVKPGRGRVLFYDVLSEDPSLAGRYDAVLAFDLLEHLDNPLAMLEALSRHVRPGGWIFINVPALSALFSDYDRAAGHVKRYGRRGLVREIQAAELEPVLTRFWGFTSVALLAMRKALVRGAMGMDERAIIRKGFAPPNRLLSIALRCIMRIETAIPLAPPIGASLLLAARTAGGDRPSTRQAAEAHAYT